MSHNKGTSCSMSRDRNAEGALGRRPCSPARPAPRRLRAAVTALIALSVVAAGCGGSDDVDDASDTPTTTAAAESAGTTNAADGSEAATETPDEPAAAEVEVVELPTLDGDLVTFTSSAMGGLRFSMSSEHHLFRAGDAVVVAPEPQTDLVWTSATLALISQSTAGQLIETAEDYLDIVRAIDGATVEPTGTAIEVLGYTLAGYDITRPEDADDESLYLFADDRVGAPVFSGDAPGPDALQFVATTPSGVLLAGVNRTPEVDDELMLAMLGTLSSSAEFTGPGLDPALPSGEELFTDVTMGTEPVPAEPSGRVEPLGPPFSDLEPGRWEMSNFSLPVSVEVPEGFAIQPNFPGLVVITAQGSGGPNDRDLVWVNDVVSYAPVSGPVAAGDPTEVTDVDSFLASPPPGITVSDVEETELVGASGETQRVVAFDIAADPTAACSTSDPCDIAFITSYGFVKEISSVHRHRIWWFPDHPNGNSMVVAAAPLPDRWMSEAIAVMSTLELS